MNFLAGVVAAEWACYKLADQGLANLLGLETLRHGTNLINYLGIKIFGGLPSQGDATAGSTITGDNTQGKFYVFKDNAWKAPAVDGIWGKTITTGFIGKRVLPNFHKFLSGCNFVRLNFLNNKLSRMTNLFLMSSGIMCGFATLAITPTLKFRVTPTEVLAKFQNDPQYHGSAYYTTDKIAMWKIGLLGTLTQGLNYEAFDRAYKNPSKTLTGIVQITAAVGLAALGLYALPAASAFVVPVGIGLIALA